VPVAAVRSKAYFCGCSIAGVAGSNLTKGMDVRLLCILCIVYVGSGFCDGQMTGFGLFPHRKKVLVPYASNMLVRSIGNITKTTLRFCCSMNHCMTQAIVSTCTTS